MTRHSSSSEPPAPAPEGSAPGEFLDGLALDRLHRSSIVAFIEGLPRRTAANLPADKPDRPGTDRVTAQSADDDKLVAAPEVGNDRVDDIGHTLQEMTDRLDALVDRLRAAGYPLNTSSDNIEETEPPTGLSDALDSAWRRFAAATSEAIRWATGIPTDAWVDSNLVEHARAAIGELGWLLRRLEDEGPATRDATSSNRSDPTSR